MAVLVVDGPCRLCGEVRVHGAKNSTLHLLAACLMCRSPVVLHNCPRLTDVDTSIKILRHLGCIVQRRKDDLWVDPRAVCGSTIPEDLMREMRSSIVFLGALSSRMGQARLSFPGGCELGPRPIDLHLRALARLGMDIREDHGELLCSAPGGLSGCSLSLSFPSVGATENILLAACCAKGTTVLHGAAQEPEITDLCDFLGKCGARIQGAGGSTLRIEGVSRLTGCEHTVMPDRIEAATFLCAAAATGGEVTLSHVIPRHILPVTAVLEEAGCRIREEENRLRITAPPRLHAVHAVRTMPYPGFPTDAQAPMLSALCTAQGTSMLTETIFTARFKYVGELLRLGAHVKVEDRVAVVEGVSRLSGAPVMAPDLRGGAALLLAGLCAEGETVIDGVSHIDRGYEKAEESFRLLGAQVCRLPGGRGEEKQSLL